MRAAVKAEEKSQDQRTWPVKRVFRKHFVLHVSESCREGVQIHMP
jgi:hypothetical protein